MKTLLRTFVFSFLALYFTRLIVDSMVFGGNYNITLLLVLLALTLLNLFLEPILKIVSLPQRGLAGLFLRFMLTALIFFVLSYMLPTFKVVSAEVSELIILGIVLPSKSLSKAWSLVYSALLFTVIYSFFMWVTKGKIKTKGKKK